MKKPYFVMLCSKDKETAHLLEDQYGLIMLFKTECEADAAMKGKNWDHGYEVHKMGANGGNLRIQQHYYLEYPELQHLEDPPLNDKSD